MLRTFQKRRWDAVVMAKSGVVRLPLDGYSPRLALSVGRRLLTSYTSNLALLLNTNDDSELGIGYDADNIFDVAAAATFLNGFTGNVKTIYDQSGNGYHFTNTTKASQPVYTADGISGRVVMTFDDGSNTVLAGVAALIQSLSACTLFTVQKLDADAVKTASVVIGKVDAGAENLFGLTLQSGAGNAVGALDGRFGYSGSSMNATSSGTYTWSDAHVTAMKASNGAAIRLFIDGAEVSGYSVQDNAASIPASIANAPAIGQNSSATSTADFEGKISEIILFDTALPDPDIISIMANLGAFY